MQQSERGTRVKVIAHSVGALGEELITFQWKYQRFIHGEIMTHRAGSRNASSSRAIPAKKLVQKALDDPAMFASVRINARGMQPGGDASPEIADQFNKEWVDLSKIVAEYVLRWADPDGMNIAKEIANRAMEPWHHIEVVFTISVTPGLKNLYMLRDHTMAQKEFQVLASMSKEAHQMSVPRQLKPGEWHLPYIHDEERTTHTSIELVVMSAARCARVSYMNHEGKLTTFEEDVSLFERLALNEPPHMSPLEHQACIAPPRVMRGLHGNLTPAWVQFRKIFERMDGMSTVIKVAHARQFVNSPILLTR